MSAFAVVVPSLPGYPYTEAFREIAETVFHGLRALDHDVVMATDCLRGRKSILFGSNVLVNSHLPIEPGAVLYNLEQCMAPVASILPAVFAQHEVWDYSARNVAHWKSIGLSSVKHVPIGYVPEMTRIVHRAKDIDVLFYGSLNDRRSTVLQQLRDRGLRVEHVFGVYGAARDAWIARSKVVLNMHLFDTGIFEIARISYLLSNEVCVVSETGLDGERFSEAVYAVKYSELVDACVMCVRNDHFRDQQALRGLKIFSQIDEREILREILGMAVEIAAEKIKINVGSGGRPMAGYLNTDITPHPGVDRVCEAWSLGLEDASVIEIQCHHVIEHFFPRDWPPALAEFWRVLAPGGKLVLSCPDFGDVAQGYVEGRYTIDDARRVVMATVPPFNSCDYDDPASYHRTVHSEASLVADLKARGFEQIATRREGLRWNLFVEATKPAARTVRADPGNMLDRWAPWYSTGKRACCYGPSETYELAETWLRGLSVEDWGCGYAQFRDLHDGPYLGIDGTPGWADEIADLRTYRPDPRPDGILLRHVLEHNPDWRAILAGAVVSFEQRMVLVLFTPDGDKVLAHVSDVDVDDLALPHAEIESFFSECRVLDKRFFPTATGYGGETVWLVER